MSGDCSMYEILEFFEENHRIGRSNISQEYLQNKTKQDSSRIFMILPQNI